MFFLRPPRPIRDLTLKLEALVRGRLWLKALLGLGLGLGLGILLGPDVGWMEAEKTKVITEWLALPGELFLRLIKMILIPLLIASIVRGLGGTTDVQKLKSVGLRFFTYLLCTTFVATTVGIVIADFVKPGSYVQLPGQEMVIEDNVMNDEKSVPIIEELPSSIVNLIPANPLASAINGEMLGIVIFSIIIGIAFAMRHNSKITPLLTLLDGILEVCMTIVKWAMWLVPFAVFGLMAKMASQVGLQTLVGMGVYVGTVLAGLLILIIFYALVVMIFGRVNPGWFMKRIASVQLLAFSTSSSAAVMPLSIQTAEEKLDVDRETAEVIVPLGATMNMDGTALYQSIAVLFLAQMAGMDLSMAQMFMIVLTLVASSIGAPGTPGVGMVILGSVAGNFGIPTTGLVLILGVDRILDMSRTVVNVTGDLTACVIFGKKKRVLGYK
jgi:Na+/H+-dicarboxylate symporter